MNVVPVRRVARILNGGTPAADEENWGGRVKWATPVDLSHVDGAALSETERTLTWEGLTRGSTIAPAGSVLVSTRAPIGYTALSQEPMAFNQGCKALVPGESVDARFLQFSLVARTPALKASGSGSTFLELSADSLAEQPINLETLDNQRRIVNFLNDRVSRVDRTLTARRLQSDLLRERFLVVLDRQLQCMPDRVRASRVLNVLPGYAFSSAKYTEVASDVPLLRGVNVGVGALRWDNIARWPAGDQAGYTQYQLTPSDVVMGMDRPWVGSGLRIAQLTEADGNPLLLQRVAKLIPGPHLDARFMIRAYESSSFREQVESDLTGLSVPHLSGGQILGFRLPYGPMRNQEEVAAVIDAEEEDALRSVNEMNRSIDLLTEYKSSLITAAVTGELDVTTAGSNIPG